MGLLILPQKYRDPKELESERLGRKDLLPMARCYCRKCHKTEMVRRKPYLVCPECMEEFAAQAEKMKTFGTPVGNMGPGVDVVVSGNAPVTLRGRRLQRIE